MIVPFFLPFAWYPQHNFETGSHGMDPQKVVKLKEECMRHLQFCCELYRIQIAGNRYFLHEHPATATSWSDLWIERLLKHPRVGSLISDQCEYGLLTPDADGIPTPAKKPTRWMSSSPFMLQRLSRR